MNRFLLCLTTAVLFACSSESAPPRQDAPATAHSSAAPVPSAPIATATVSAPIPVVTSAAPAVASGAPAPPPAPFVFAPSVRPSSEEWAAVEDMNTAPPDLKTKVGCKVKRIREWVRFECARAPVGSVQTFGPKVKMFTDKDRVEIQMAPGSLVRGGSSEEAAIYKAAWPTGQTHPTIHSIQRPSTRSNLVEFAPIEEIPVIPGDPSPRPQPGDWEGAVSVNTASADSRIDACEMRVVRDWVRLRCLPKGSKHAPEVLRERNAGKRGTDFIVAADMELLTIYVRVRKPLDARFVLCFDCGSPTRLRTTFAVTWPGSAPKPTAIEVRRGASEEDWPTKSEDGADY